jgi:hypothetical protein
MRVYIANKMTGLPQFNYPWFEAAAEDLRRRGHDVVSPAELDSPEVRAIALASTKGDVAELAAAGTTWGEILAEDVKLIADDGIDAIVVGPDWADSKGAKLETFVAYQLGLPVLAYPELTPVSREVLASAWIGSPARVHWRPVLEAANG